MYIETARMLIRAFRPEDAGDLQEILGDAETMKYSEPPYSPEKTRSFLTEFCIGKNAALAAIQKSSGKVIGYILFKPLDEAVYEIGWFFNRSCWRQGYAYECCSQVIAYAFDKLQAHEVMAETIDAQKSVPLMEKLGMTLTEIQKAQSRDTLGNPADLYVYKIRRKR